MTEGFPGPHGSVALVFAACAAQRSTTSETVAAVAGAAAASDSCMGANAGSCTHARSRTHSRRTSVVRSTTTTSCAGSVGAAHRHPASRGSTPAHAALACAPAEPPRAPVPADVDAGADLGWEHRPQRAGPALCRSVSVRAGRSWRG